MANNISKIQSNPIIAYKDFTFTIAGTQTANIGSGKTLIGVGIPVAGAASQVSGSTTTINVSGSISGSTLTVTASGTNSHNVQQWNMIGTTVRAWYYS